jgi:hypothetical protein
MINTIKIKKENNEFVDTYWAINNESIDEIRRNYKIIDVDWLDPILVNSEIFNDKYFQKPEKMKTVNNMLNYYLNHKDKKIYEKTDYICNEKEKICICNTNAEAFRKIYDQHNYKKDNKYISWFRIKN